MSYILVTADFPNVTSDQRNKIYDCLSKKNWIKVKEFGRDISTAWYGSFNNEVNEAKAKEIAIKNFEDCSQAYCKPKLVIHWGPNKPTFHNLS